MYDSPRLLVVDDEEVVCQGCRRIFAPQGFEVETSTDPREGLRLASEKDYAAVVLDIRMPSMSGIQFLEQLRGKKPDIPVVLITAYPSVPDAASAMRLGAADYVTKPFTPEDLTRTIQRVLGPRMPQPVPKPAPAVPAPEPWGTQAEPMRFWDEAWYATEGEGVVRVGAVLPSSRGASADAIRLPQVGDVVHQGLPLAALMHDGQLIATVPSPLSGVVTAVNPALERRVALLWEDPFRQGWIATIAPSQFEQDAEQCRPRRVLVANANAASAQDQSAHLTRLGCQVRTVATWDELATAVAEPQGAVLLVDAASLGEQGPEWVGRVCAESPAMKVVVVASTTCPWETAYRRHRIFYYAVEPFGDNEILEILDTAFRAHPIQVHQAPASRPTTPDLVSSIFITNRSGKQVGLFVAGGLLSKEDGLGWHIRRKLVDRLYPVKISSGIGRITQIKLLLAAGMCDRLVVLLPKDLGRLPGSLARDIKGSWVSLSGPVAEKVVTLAVQPLAPDAGLAGFDDRTMAALAEHVAREMAAC